MHAPLQIPELLPTVPPGTAESLTARLGGKAPRPQANYWAARDADEVVQELNKKEQQYFDFARGRGFLDAWLASFCQHHGLDPQDVRTWASMRVHQGGDDDELLYFRLGEVSSYSDQMVMMALGNRPAFETYAVNASYDSLAQAEPADRIVSYVYENRFGEARERACVTRGVRYGWSWAWLQWDSDAGERLPPEEELVTVKTPNGDEPVIDPRTGGPKKRTVPSKKRTGHLVAKSLYPWEQFCEPRTVDPGDHLWRVARDHRSKYELAAKFPDKAERILALQPLDKYSFENLFSQSEWSATSSTDEVAVKHFYHVATDALNEANEGPYEFGRHICYAGDVVLFDRPLAYQSIPLVEFKPWPYDGNAFGNTPIWDMLSVNEVFDELASNASTVLSNFGRTSLVMDEGTALTPSDLATGSRVFTKKPTTDMPKFLEPPQLPPAWQQLATFCEKRFQSRSNLNAVTRGDPQHNITSGTMAALFHSIAIEANSGLQVAVDNFREELANMMLDVLKRFAEHPMVVGMTGVDQRDYADSFTRDKLSGIRGVRVKTANPLSRTTAGRMEMAQFQLKVPGAITDPAQLNEILISGQATPLFKSPRSKRLRIALENELLADVPAVEQKTDPPPPPIMGPQGVPLPGPPPEPPYQSTPTVPVMATDLHPLHIAEHTALLGSRRALEDPQYAAAVLAHIDHHLYVWRTTDPARLAAFGIPPYPGAMPTPPPGGPGAPAGAGAPPGGPGGKPGLPGGPGGKPGQEPGDSQPKAMQHKGGPDIGAPQPKPAESPIKR